MIKWSQEMNTWLEEFQNFLADNGLTSGYAILLRNQLTTRQEDVDNGLTTDSKEQDEHFHESFL